MRTDGIIFMALSWAFILFLVVYSFIKVFGDKNDKFRDTDIIISPDVLRKQRIPPGQTVVSEFPVLHHGTVPEIDIEKYRIKIFGLVKQEKQLTLDQIFALPHVQLRCDIHCVTGWSLLDTLWTGISTVEIKKLVEILPEAKYVIVHAVDNWTTNLQLEDFFAEDVILAYNYEEKPIFPEHGGPLRLIVPRLYFWKSAKWVCGIEFVAEDVPGFWEKRGYHMRGDPWKEERFQEK